MLGHLLRAGGAIEADERHVERVDDRRRRGDVGADQQACRWSRPSPGRRSACRLPAAARARLAPLTAALICSGSWQVSIRIASTPPATRPRALLGQRVLERLIGDMAERRQPRARPDRAEDEARAAVCANSATASRASSAARRLSAKALSAMPNSPSVIGEPPKLLVCDRVGAGARDSRDGSRAPDRGGSRTGSRCSSRGRGSRARCRGSAPAPRCPSRRRTAAPGRRG